MISCFRQCTKASARTFCYIEKTIPTLTTARPLSFLPQKYSEVENFWRKNDGVSREWELIYKAPIAKYIGLCSTFNTAVPVILVAGGIHFYFNVLEDSTAPIVLPNSDIVIANNLHQFFVYIAGFIIIHAIVKVVISRFVTRMYKNGDNYLAAFYGYWHKQTKTCQFNKTDFKKLKKSSFSFGDSQYSLGNKKGILVENYFKTPYHLNEMLRPTTKC